MHSCVDNKKVEQGITSFHTRLLILRYFLKLTVIQISIESFLTNQFLMVAALYDVTVFHDKDEIRISNGRQTMGNNEGGFANHQLIHRFLNQ
ncbi:hypothetical protein D3C77_655860 [compost metagenome]